MKEIHMKTAASDVYAELEREAQGRGISAIAVLAEKAKAEGKRMVEKFNELVAKAGGVVLLRESARPPRPQSLESAFERLGHSPRSARVAAGLNEATAPTKHEDPGSALDADGKPIFAGGDFGRSDYGFTPSDVPATWELLLTTTPGGAPDPDFVRAAVELLDPANPAPGPNITVEDLPAVLAKVAKAWQKAIPDEQLPAILTAEAAAFLRLGVPLRGLEAAARGRIHSRRF
jgi:hypothetical protein